MMVRGVFLFITLFSKLYKENTSTADIDKPWDWGQTSTGCYPNQFSPALKRFLINLRFAPGDFKTRPSGSTS